jgi:hypothetical protein
MSQQAVLSPAEPTTETPTEAGAFTRVMAQIVADSKQNPWLYLDEVVVPHGGE